MRASRLGRLITATVLLAGGLSGLAAEDVATGGEVVVYPVGWASEGQIKSALSRISDDYTEFERGSDSLIVHAPMSGRLSRSAGEYVLSGDRIRIRYPVSQRSWAQDDGQVSKDDAIIHYPLSENPVFLFMLLDRGSGIEPARPKGGQLRIYSNRPEPVYSAVAGELLLTPPPPGVARLGNLSLFQGNANVPLVFIYAGVGDVSAGLDSTSVEKGARIGAMTKTGGEYQILVVIVGGSSTQFDPWIVYMEVSE